MYSLLLCLLCTSLLFFFFFFFFSSRRRHTRWPRDWSSDVCSSDLPHLCSFGPLLQGLIAAEQWAEAAQVGSALLQDEGVQTAVRSEERRVGKECRDRWAQ